MLCRDILEVDEVALSSRQISFREDAAEEGGADGEDKAMCREGGLASGQGHISQGSLQNRSLSQQLEAKLEPTLVKKEYLLKQLLCN